VIARIRNETKRSRRIIGLLFISMIIIFIFSLFIGRYPAPGFSVIEVLQNDPMARQIVLNLRLPRVLISILLGMSLAGAGIVLQMLLSNPLVEPGFLGISQGAAFGAALSILFFEGTAWAIQTGAILFALLGLGLSYQLARHIRFGGWVLRLILAGIVISALFSAGIGILKYIADPLSQLPEITFWILGGLWAVTWNDLMTITPIVLIGLFIMIKARWRLNLLSLDDKVSHSLGISVIRERGVLLLAAVAVTAAVVSVSGIVNWLGLLIPHMARRLFGADTRFVVPASLLIGAIFAMLCDDIGRVMMTGEIPLGILTSLFGGILFSILMVTKNSRDRR